MPGGVLIRALMSNRIRIAASQDGSQQQEDGNFFLMVSEECADGAKGTHHVVFYGVGGQLKFLPDFTVRHILFPYQSINFPLLWSEVVYCFLIQGFCFLVLDMFQNGIGRLNTGPQKIAINSGMGYFAMMINDSVAGDGP